ncbi:MAG: peptidoglycan DD-metalloendopeptidase family protein [Anaerolineales bacterium]|nr:peptidoglycan DD-metalloendopeptidase family protein [Anaerolineales bacterium]MCX7608831.1 peptidoglycan DD-metalloendopeptidase family protein [Anaerolineales bacterium]MDW8445929.1 peptidoglycan DD-metalloendopeptidase family protein [Anaerolineales bacterium]
MKSASSPLRLAIVLSWGVTILFVLGAFSFLAWRFLPLSPTLEPSSTPTQNAPSPGELPVENPLLTQFQPIGIARKVLLKTSFDPNLTYQVRKYKVKRGDSIFGIANQFGLKPETVLWANYDTLQDDPHSIRPDQVLYIPPIDGVYYKWKEGDTLEGIAEKFQVSVEDILNWPGNDIDLTNPTIQAGQYVMVPGGKREFVQWIIPTVARGRSGTARVGGTSCSGGPIGSTAFIWPTGQHWLSGNDYWSGHLGIDIAAAEGAPVWAADAGTVTMAQGGWNYGYGNVIMIDHGNGYVTLYAHLSQINVVVCQGVSAGQLIGLAGNTGNSFGSHLHFEVRLNGGFVNPWYVLPPP